MSTQTPSDGNGATFTKTRTAWVPEAHPETITTDTPEITTARLDLCDARRHLAATVAVMDRVPATASTRVRNRARRLVEDAEAGRDLAVAAVERAVRAANPGAVEGDLRAAARNL